MDIESQYSKGALAIEALKAYNFDQCFLSCSALSTYGVSDYSTEGSAFSGYMVGHSLQSILLAEQDKLGKNSLHKYAEITDFDYIVLNDPSSVPTQIRKALEKSSTKLIFACLHYEHHAFFNIVDSIWFEVGSLESRKAPRLGKASANPQIIHPLSSARAGVQIPAQNYKTSDSSIPFR